MLQLPNVLANMTLFFGALVVSFVFAWRLALAGLPFTLLFVAPSVVLGKRMPAAAYEEAGGVAEQAVSSIRTVVSYRGERQTLERFGRALARSTALGIKQGLIKGAVIGSLGIMYAVWSFMSSYTYALFILKNQITTCSEDGDGDPVGQRTLNVWRWRWRLSVEMQ